MADELSDLRRRAGLTNESDIGAPIPGTPITDTVVKSIQQTIAELNKLSHSSPINPADAIKHLEMALASITNQVNRTKGPSQPSIDARRYLG